jgi:nucleoside 2-deoxyribosyltransferase
LRDRAVYLAGPDGFTEPGRLFHAQVLIPKVTAAGWRPLDPWAYLFDPAPAGSVAGGGPGQPPPDAHEIGRRNAELIDAADAVLANLEGTDVDSGTAAEIGYAFARGIPVAGFRVDDRRTGENLGTTVNLQVEYFIGASGGAVYANLDEAIASLGPLLDPVAEIG